MEIQCNPSKITLSSSELWQAPAVLEKDELHGECGRGQEEEEAAFRGRKEEGESGQAHLSEGWEQSWDVPGAAVSWGLGAGLCTGSQAALKAFLSAVITPVQQCT